MASKTGVVFNVQRFSIHDGPGIRTTVFFKGCSLDCPWCSNPESKRREPEFFLNDLKCVLCGNCAKVCGEGAIAADEKSRVVDRARCSLCLDCADACLTGAITRVGKECGIDEIMREVMSDELFYKNSGGGVTLSGGEPLAQCEFALELLKECKAKGLHTALDTCGFAKWDAIEEILEFTDLVLYDIKHVDSEKHREACGVGTELIVENAKKITGMKEMWVRVPVIPGFSSKREDVAAILDFVRSLNPEKLSLLPYHNTGRHKYERLGIPYALADIGPMSDDEVLEIADVERSELLVSIGR